MNTLGTSFKITTFGESHGNCIGVVIDGCPAGLRINVDHIQKELDRRRPGQSSVTTSRSETDTLEILSGIFHGYTTGSPICMIIPNKSTDSSFYEENWMYPRPGHADFTAYYKYGGFNDNRGGGMFSGRITASFVIAGAIAKQLLSESLNIKILAYTSSIGGISISPTNLTEIIGEVDQNIVRCPDPVKAKEMINAIEKAKQEGDSLGGAIDCVAINTPIGLGEPLFDTLEGDLAKAIFSIPAVKAIEFGAGTKFSQMKGSEANDQYLVANGIIKTSSNNSGGILGGISNGMPIIIKTTLKPTPSIRKHQNTINIVNKNEKDLSTQGRHDPCIVPRAVPVIEAVVAIVLADHAIKAGFIKHVLEKLE
ncbi:chorismate synthase [Candidatus Bathyarchaeota archaeon]|nr:chorismate synthase [Candidatus Bathyarchaeota archaeon]